MSWFQWGQKAANNNQTAAAPKGATQRESDQYGQGHKDQQAKNNKK